MRAGKTKESKAKYEAFRKSCTAAICKARPSLRAVLQKEGIEVTNKKGFIHVQPKDKDAAMKIVKEKSKTVRVPIEFPKADK